MPTQTVDSQSLRIEKQGENTFSIFKTYILIGQM